VAGLNHSFIYPTVIIILVSVLVFIFFSLINKFDSTTSNFENSFNACSWFFGGVLWSVFVYMQELEKKSSFVSGHKKVRYY
jgi:Ca2+/Na+ antiporter